MELKTFVSKDMGENCYTVGLNGEILVVDPGEFSQELENFLTENSTAVKYILLTHCHFDHIGGLERVKNLCKNAKVVINGLDSPGLADPNVNLSAYFGPKIIAYADLKVDEGDKLPFGNSEITVLHTPGHTKGSSCFLIEDCIFSGDTLFKESYGRTDFPGGSSTQMRDSLKRLCALSADYKVFSGHGLPTTIDYEKRFNPGINS